MRTIAKATALVALVAILAVSWEERAVAAPVGVDGVIGPEWTGVTPVFIPFGPASPGGQLVAFNVYVRTDAEFCYIAAEAVPASGDQWTDAFNLGLGSCANFQIDTDPIAAPSFDDININPCGGFSFGFAYGGPGLTPERDADLQPLMVTGGSVGSVGPDVGGVREVAIGWTVLETDPDAVGFPVLTASNPSLILRRVQGFGNNFSGSFPFNLGSCTDPNFAPATIPTLSWHGWLLLGVLLALTMRWALYRKVRVR